MSETKVQKAIRFLDMYATPGWRTKIDLDTLDMDDSTLCILGQIYGNYSDSWKIREKDEWDDWGLPRAFNSNDYREEWRELLRAPVGPQVGEEWKNSYNTYKVVSRFQAEGKEYVGYRGVSVPEGALPIVTTVEGFMRDCTKKVEPKYVVGHFYTDVESHKLVLFCDRENHFERLNSCTDRSGWSGGISGDCHADWYVDNYGDLVEIKISDNKTLKGEIDS